MAIVESAEVVYVIKGSPNSCLGNTRFKTVITYIAQKKRYDKEKLLTMKTRLLLMFLWYLKY